MKNKLIKIAAKMVTKEELPSLYVGDYKKKMTRKDWQRVFDKIHNKTTAWALDIMDVVKDSERKKSVRKF